MKMWVKNSLQVVSSSKEEIENFAEQNKNKTCLDLNRSVPIERIEDPDQYKQELAKQWGCLSNGCQPIILYKPDSIIYRFNTNGNSPILWLVKVSLMYPKIYFHLSSTNEHNFKGQIGIKDGIIKSYKDLKMV